MDGLTDKIAKNLKDVNGEEVKVIVHVGTNDCSKIRSQVLLDKIRNLIRTAMKARSNVTVDICSIPSRKDLGDFVFSRAESVNDQLAELCKNEGVPFHNLKACMNMRNYLQNDGVHYSTAGAERVGVLLAERCDNFLV